MTARGDNARGHEADLFGEIDGEYWSASVEPTADGAYRFLAPHGLENAQIDTDRPTSTPSCGTACRRTPP